MGGEERLDLGLDRLHQHPPGALPQHGQQRVVGDARSWPRQGDHAILLHGVSSRVIGTLQSDVSANCRPGEASAGCADCFLQLVLP